MSMLVYNFLENSFLLKEEELANNYKKFSEFEIKSELQSYRDYIIKNIKKIDEEISIYGNMIRLFQPYDISELSKIKEMAFYLDQVIVPDSLFPLSIQEGKQKQVFNEFLGGKESSINRENLSNLLKRIKEVKPMVEVGYVKFFPITYFFEENSEIPFIYSETAFSDTLPKNLMTYYHQNGKVRSFSKNGPYLKVNKNFELDRTIDIEFADNDIGFTNMYNLLEQKILNYDEAKGIAEISMHLPKEKPSKESFENWVYQSLNKSASHHFGNVVKNISLSSRLKSHFVTSSTFVSHLINSKFESQNNIESTVINSMLNFDLKFFDDVNLDTLMSIRKNDGEEFQLFRRELEKNLRELKNIQNEDIFKSKIEDVKHEMQEVQVSAINSKVKHMRKGVLANTIMGVGGLSTSVISGGFSLVATAMALANGYKSYLDYQKEVQENPSFFLWKVKKYENK